MTENSCAFPIKAHQQVLLRRPRAPQRDPRRQRSKNTLTNLPPSRYAGSKDGTQKSGDADSKLDVLGPLPPLHPTPFTPYRQPPLPHPPHPHSSHPHTISHSFPGPTGEIYSLGSGYSSDLLLPPGGHSGKLGGPAPPEELQFTLNDFLIDLDEVESNLMPTKLRGCTVSVQNYLKLTSWFSTHVPQHTSLNTLYITGIYVPAIYAAETFNCVYMLTYKSSQP